MTPFAPFGGATGTAAIVPFPPNWDKPVDETLAWKMAPVMTQVGTEQRRSLRIEPRLRVEYESLLSGGDVPLAQSMLTGWANKDFAVPLWYGKTRLALAASGSALALRDSPDTLIFAGSWVLLWANSRTFAAARVDSVFGTVVQLAEPLGQTWPAGTVVVPLQCMQLQDSQGVGAVTAGVVRVSWVFDQVPGHAPTLPEYPASDWTDTFPGDTDPTEPRNHYLGSRHNWAGSPQITVTSSADVFDPGTGVLSRRLDVDVPGFGWALDVLLARRQQTADLRKFLSAHRGPGVAFWAPSLLADARPAGALNGARVPVADDGQSTTPHPLRAGLEIAGAGWVERERVKATRATELELYRSVAARTPTRLRWVSACRLATESVTISHQTDGVATVRLPVVAVDPSVALPILGGGSGGGGGSQGAYAGAAPLGDLDVQFVAGSFAAAEETSGFVLLRLSRATADPVTATVTFDTGQTATVTFPAGGAVVQPVSVPSAKPNPGTLATITSATGAAIGALKEARVIGPGLFGSLFSFDNQTLQNSGGYYSAMREASGTNDPPLFVSKLPGYALSVFPFYGRKNYDIQFGSEISQTADTFSVSFTGVLPYVDARWPYATTESYLSFGDNLTSFEKYTLTWGYGLLASGSFGQHVTLYNAANNTIAARVTFSNVAQVSAEIVVQVGLSGASLYVNKNKIGQTVPANGFVPKNNVKLQFVGGNEVAPLGSIMVDNLRVLPSFLYP